MEKVSIVIPTFGRAINLKRAIDSCLSQTYNNIEIVVVDDNGQNSAAREETSALMHTYYSANKIVKYICHADNLNGSAARNTGIEHSSGKFVAFLDDDDEFLNDKINCQVDLLKNRGVKAVYTRCLKYKDNIKLYETTYSSNERSELLYDIFCQNIEINSSAILCDKELLVQLDGFDVSFQRNQDYEFLIRLLRKNELLCVDKPLYIIHIDSKMNQLNFENYEQIRVYFMKKFQQDKMTLSLFKRINITRLFHFDLAYYALRNNNFKSAFKYVIKCFPEPSLLFLVWPRITRILKQKK